MITIEEQGRRLKITVGGELELLVPPVPSDVGVTLLSHYVSLLNIGAGILAGADDIERLTTDLAELSLGRPIPKDPDAPTEREQARLDQFAETWEVYGELRAEEQAAVFEAAFFWQTFGGGFNVAEASVRDGREKAQALLFAAAGLELTRDYSPTSASGTPAGGDVVPSTNAPAVTNDTSSPPKSAPRSKAQAGTKNPTPRKPRGQSPVKG